MSNSSRSNAAVHADVCCAVREHFQLELQGRPRLRAAPTVTLLLPHVVWRTAHLSAGESDDVLRRISCGQRDGLGPSGHGRNLPIRVAVHHVLHGHVLNSTSSCDTRNLANRKKAHPILLGWRVGAQLQSGSVHDDVSNHVQQGPIDCRMEVSNGSSAPRALLPVTFIPRVFVWVTALSLVCLSNCASFLTYRVPPLQLKTRLFLVPRASGTWTLEDALSPLGPTASPRTLTS